MVRPRRTGEASGSHLGRRARRPSPSLRHGGFRAQVKLAPSGVDEQAGILLMNPAGEMATVALTMHAKQPKRGMVAFENGYLEIYDYPRAEKAVITYTEDGHTEEISCGKTDDALRYEVLDMERAVAGIADEMHFDYTCDVMELMTRIRKDWGLSYPEEE